LNDAAYAAIVRGNMILNREQPTISGRVTVKHLASKNGKSVPIERALSPAMVKNLAAKGLRVESLFKNLVVNAGRGKLARLLGGSSSGGVDRIQLGDCVVDGLVRKDLYPADLGDVSLVHEIRSISGNPGATFDVDSVAYPDEVTKTDASIGTPGVLVAGGNSTLSDPGADFVSDGVNDSDTVTVLISGQSYVLGVVDVISSTQLSVDNPAGIAGAVGYTVQTPGTQVLFRKLINADNFPENQFGPVTVVHEAGLLFTDGTLFNRVLFQAQDNDIGLVLQPTDIDGTRIDIQLDWLITF